MSEQEIKQIEFEKFKRELLACIKQLTINDTVTLILDYGEPAICEECGKLHKGVRCLSNSNIKNTFAAAELLAKKATEQLLGIDDNKWGKVKEN
jgi:hypothetical protein